MQDKFRLDLSDEEAVQFLQALIDESVSAVFASVVEQIHKWAQVHQIITPLFINRLISVTWEMVEATRAVKIAKLRHYFQSNYL